MLVRETRGGPARSDVKSPRRVGGPPGVGKPGAYRENTDMIPQECSICKGVVW